MLKLEVLQSYPSQKKALLTSLGVVDPFYYCLIVFLVDTLEHPPLPSFVSFKIPVQLHNAIISQRNIEKDASTYVMFAAVWKQLKSPEISLPTISLCVWDDHSSQALDIYCNRLVTLAVRFFM